MIATSTYATVPHAPPVPTIVPMAEARLCLAPDGAAPDELCGAWWPRSRDAGREFPSLVAAMDLRFGRIEGVTVRGSLWQGRPSRIAGPGRMVDMEWQAAEGLTMESCVLSSGAGRRHLLVVPPEGDLAESALLMLAADLPDQQGIRSWLANVTDDRSAAGEQHAREASWESEGGSGAPVRSQGWAADDRPSPDREVLS